MIWKNKIKESILFEALFKIFIHFHNNDVPKTSNVKLTYLSSNAGHTCATIKIRLG